MKPERIEYQALLESLADGADVDWAVLDTFGATEAERRRYRNLRLVARIAELHRTLGAGDDTAPPDTAATERPPLTVPDRWGHLEIVERIAGGSFGDVYLARDPHLTRDVALKLLRVD